ncbi:hypothetical protein ACIBL5_37645 [Streptomyces sp. NPDC050516]|uniref:hypothetical protein n=1 Tax=Streptomyces sp. NPDC050516 TaxID=3365621 RepID=UPI0037958006
MRKSRLLIAVAAHSDAGLQAVFADGPCTTVAREALAKAGARPQGRRITVQPLKGWPHDSVMLAEDRAGHPPVVEADLPALPAD